MRRTLLAGLIAIALIVGLWLIKNQFRGFSTKNPPTAIERIVARSVRDWAVPAESKSITNPVVQTEAVLAEAREHWADHCAGCHANNGSGDTEMGKNLYPPAPDMRQTATQNLTDGQLFYFIENGIRMTGMPAWGDGTAKSESASWKLVHFIRRLPKVTQDEVLQMQRMNPRTPAEFLEEQEIEKFLKGEDSHATQSHHAH
ncbi:MAG: c-type cytochrome [Bryobacterales bacterium]|nr:c-type cytochrome [Bryobacterales bacterium]